MCERLYACESGLFYFMKHYREVDWARQLIPGGNRLINLSTGEEEIMQPILKMYDCELKDFSERERAFTATASTEAIDRDGDILRASGWKLKNYKRNPVVLWGHDAGVLPIAKAKDIRIEDNKLKFRPQFATAEQNPFAEQVFQMFKAGFLRAFSVRFDPIESVDRELTDAEKTKYGQYFRKPQDYKSLELLEISAVNVPANPEALKSAAMHDFVVKSYLESNIKLFPGVDIPKADKIANLTKSEFDFADDLKEKREKLEKLLRDRELKKAELAIDMEIASIEKEMENETSINELKSKLSLLQNGITGLVKK